ncbi:hypothetical protein ABWK57_13900 [Streptomyces sp. NPDC094045]|uniref:hypothetical protein n=1 Tax=unclassified Streptomyces TaxID=2593676 RepID=UPI0033912910
MQHATVTDIHRTILFQGGITYRPDVVAPTTGYMVSLAGSERMMHVDRFSVAAYEQYLTDYRIRVRSTNALFYGAWVDGGYVYLDLSINVQSLEEAKGLGHMESQLAIFDVANETVISL